jgi:DNA-directed RNA polymerase specialized sigma24 family protein
MTDEDILRNLLSGTAPLDSSWEVFLRRFSNLILKVIWQFEKDHDEVMEKYLRVCNKLAEKNFATLRRYETRSPVKTARFSTWLAAVTRNLCIDAHRATHGRKELPRAVLQLEEFDREVFRLYYWKGYSLEEVEQRLANHDGATPASVMESLVRIESVVAGSAARVRQETLNVRFDDEAFSLPPDSEDDFKEMLEWLERWLNELEDQERMIIRLRFWEGMTGPEIAKAMRLSPEGRVYPLLQQSLGRLRQLATRTYTEPKIGGFSV